MRFFIVCTILVFCLDTFWAFLKEYPAFFGLIGVLVGATIAFGVNYYLFIKKLESDKDFYEQKRKDDVSFKLVDQYFEKFDEIAEVKGLLVLSKEIYDEIEMNRILKLGNWYNFAKGLENTEMINDEILGNMPLGIEIKEFEAHIIKKSKKTKNKNGQTKDFIKMRESWEFLFNNKDKKSREDKVLVECNNERKEQIEQEN